MLLPEYSPNEPQSARISARMCARLNRLSLSPWGGPRRVSLDWTCSARGKQFFLSRCTYESNAASVRETEKIVSENELVAGPAIDRDRVRFSDSSLTAVAFCLSLGEL